MKNILCFLLLATTSTFCVAQIDKTNVIADQIKIERDKELEEFRNKLQANEKEIKELTEKMSTNDRVRTQDKLETLEKLQKALDERTQSLEQAPKSKVNYNGQLAFTELLSIQRDLQPAQLFSSSQEFFTQLGSISDLKKYQSFNTWKTEYDTWYNGQNKSDQMLQLVNNSISLIGDIANKVPLYGSIVQTASSGIASIIANAGNKHKNLVSKTPEMLKLLNAASQFENQKAIIDHEWEQINKELRQLQIENDLLLNDQLHYYDVAYNRYKVGYLDATLDSDRDKFKSESRSAIIAKLMALDSDPVTKDKWLGQVEKYMYRVQSLRIRFGNLTNRMLSNITRYESLIELFSDESKFPKELATPIAGLGKTLASVRKNFSTAFKPEKYIEDSVVMYIGKS